MIYGQEKNILKHIGLVNIVGEPSVGILIRQITMEFSATSTSECLFANFLFEIEPKKVSKELKEPSWVNEPQEELKHDGMHVHQIIQPF